MLPISVMGLIGHALSDHKRFLKNKSQVSILEQILLLEIDESSFTEIKFEFEDAHISYSINISNNSSNTTSQETNRFKKTKSKLDENKCPRSVSEILKAIEKEDNGIEKEKEENKKMTLIETMMKVAKRYMIDLNVKKMKISKNQFLM